jgi:hypothetical protein
MARDGGRKRGAGWREADTISRRRRPSPGQNGRPNLSAEHTRRTAMTGRVSARILGRLRA